MLLEARSPDAGGFTSFRHEEALLWASSEPKARDAAGADHGCRLLRLCPSAAPALTPREAGTAALCLEMGQSNLPPACSHQAGMSLVYTAPPSSWRFASCSPAQLEGSGNAIVARGWSPRALCLQLWVAHRAPHPISSSSSLLENDSTAGGGRLHETICKALDGSCSS